MNLRALEEPTLTFVWKLMENSLIKKQNELYKNANLILIKNNIQTTFFLFNLYNKVLRMACFVLFNEATNKALQKHYNYFYCLDKI